MNYSKTPLELVCKHLLVLQLGICATSAQSQNPDNAVLEKIRQDNQRLLEQVNIRGVQSGQSSNPGTGKVVQQPTKTATLPTVPVTTIPKLIRPSAQTATPRDLSQLAEQFQKTPPVGQKNSGVMVFISQSMPVAVLQELAKQAALADVTFVLRGFLSDPSKPGAPGVTSTTNRIAHLLSVNGSMGSTPNWTIDPDAFKTFGVKQVPAFVVAEQVGDGNSCSQTTTQMCENDWNAVVIYGDISLADAMKRAMRSPQPGVIKLAQTTLAKLEMHHRNSSMKEGRHAK